MSHKEQMRADIHSVFFACSEYAEMRTVNGAPMHVVDDTDSLVDWTDGEHTDGLYTSDKLLRIPASEYGARPKPMSDITIDGAHWRVVEAVDDLGVYALRIRRAKM